MKQHAHPFHYKVALTAIAAVAVIASFMLTGCQGRTAENMQPTGETVEVEIQPLDAAPTNN